MAELTPHQLRDVAQKLAALLASGDEPAIARFKRQRLGEREVSVEHLVSMRVLLEELAQIFASDDAVRWGRLDAARLALDAVDDVPSESEADVETPRAEDLAPVKPPRVDDVPAPLLPNESAVALPLLRPATRSPWAHGAPPAPPLVSIPSPRPPLPPPTMALDPVVSTEAAPRPDLQVTAAVDERSARAALPFAEREDATRQLSFSSMAQAFAMSVEEYAGLCAERDHDPAAIKHIHARYAVVDSRGGQALDRLFYALFAEAPDTRVHWQGHYQRYVQLLRER